MRLSRCSVFHAWLPCGRHGRDDLWKSLCRSGRRPLCRSVGTAFRPSRSSLAPSIPHSGNEAESISDEVSTNQPVPSFSITRVPVGPPRNKDLNRKNSASSPRLWRNKLRNGIIFEDGQLVVDEIRLRDACKCPRCVDPSDKQRNYSYADIPIDIHVGSYQVLEDGSCDIAWKNDVPGFEGHVSHFSKSEIQKLGLTYRNDAWRLSQRPLSLWKGKSFTEQTARVSYTAYMTDDEALATALHLLWRDGLVFLDEVPEREDAVKQIVERIGPLNNTFYGPTWDVRSVPQAKNVAYTSKHLGFHMDLLYMREPPGLQFLHCLHNTCPGGESRFVDTFNAAAQLWTQNADYFHALQEYPVRYEYSNDGYFYTDIKRTITLKEAGSVLRRPVQGPYPKATKEIIADIARCYWSPPFLGHIPDQLDGDEMRRFIRASNAFSSIFEEPANVVEEKMEGGTCVIFDNLRVLHARNAFDLNSGKRWLRGAYLNQQDFVSRSAAVQHLMPPLSPRRHGM